jgi:hypothetical protein
MPLKMIFLLPTLIGLQGTLDAGLFQGEQFKLNSPAHAP